LDNKTFSATTGRAHWTFALEIVLQEALTTGMGNEGNVQILRTVEFNDFNEETGEWFDTEAPAVSGQAFKATLREHCFLVMVEALGLQTDEVSRDGLRLILKGGKNDKGETSVSLQDLREMRALLPIIDVFGALDQGQAMPGAIIVSAVLPWCQSLADAGIAPVNGIRGANSVIRMFQRESKKERAEGAPPEFYTLPPMPDHMMRGEEQQYKHDLTQTHITHVLMMDGDKKAIATQQSLNAANHKPVKSEDRRAVNESMPYSFQTIKRGTPMFATIRLVDCAPTSAALLAAGIEHWINSGAHLGSGKSVGRGACRVNVAGTLCIDSRTGETRAQGEETGILKNGVNPHAEILRAHFVNNAAAIRAKLAEVVR